MKTKKIRLTENFIEKIIGIMPHGSGIDCEYWATKSHGKLLLHNSFHNMNDVGYYDGYSEFTVQLIIRNDGNIILHKIVFNKSTTDSYVYRKYSNNMLKEYLYNTYQYFIDEYNDILL